MKTPVRAYLKRILAPRSLRYQLLTRSLLIIAALLIAIGIFQYWFMKGFIYKNQADTMLAQVGNAPREVFSDEWKGKEWQPPNRQHNGNGRPYFFLQNSSLALAKEDGSITSLSDGQGLPPPVLSKEQYAKAFAQLKAQQVADYWVVPGAEGTGEQLVVFRYVGGPGRTDSDVIIQMSTATAPLENMLLRQLVIFLSLSGIALLAAFGLCLPVIRRTLTPLSRIVSAVQRTDAGNLNERLPIRQGQEEIDRLSDSFNGMLERLEESFQVEREAKEQMRRFIADASHELRTPLTSIHGFLEVLLRGAMDRPEQLKSALTSMHGESKRINKLVEDLLLLAKLDRAPQLSFRESQLDKIVEEMEPQLRMLAGSRSTHIHTKPGIKGSWDPDKIKQVILNLFHNAVQHTDAETGRISLTLVSRGGVAELTIQDNGIGIAEEHLPHVFDRFYRGESSRNRRSGGAGLGLSITKSLVEGHGGTIEVVSSVGRGTSFVIRLPLDRGTASPKTF